MEFYHLPHIFETNIPTEVLEAAKIDGSNELIFFMRIALPLSKSILAVMTLFLPWNIGTVIITLWFIFEVKINIPFS